MSPNEKALLAAAYAYGLANAAYARAFHDWTKACPEEYRQEGTRLDCPGFVRMVDAACKANGAAGEALKDAARRCHDGRKSCDLPADVQS